MIEKYSPDQVAEMIISIDPTFHLPSDEQRPIISIYDNPLEPAVVIAGAGSGKTETMAARVVYLVAKVPSSHSRTNLLAAIQRAASPNGCTSASMP